MSESHSSTNPQPRSTTLSKSTAVVTTHNTLVTDSNITRRKSVGYLPDPLTRNHMRSSRPQDSAITQSPAMETPAKKTPKTEYYDTLINRYELQSTVRDLLPGSRCAKCQRSIIPGADSVTMRLGAGGKVTYGNLQRCSSVWTCPYCAPQITEQRKKELNEALYIEAPKLGLYPVMVTLTLSHHFGQTLQDLLNVLCGTRVSVEGRKSKKEIPGARNILLSGRKWQSLATEYGVAGWIHNLEILYSTMGNGWHPHIHMILMLDRVLDGKAATKLQSQLRRMWLPSLRKAGKNFGQKITASWEHGCKVTTDAGNIADYVSKYGKLPANTWTVATEITKAQMKHRTEGFNIWELIALAGDGVGESARLVKEYYFATKGRKQLQWSEKLRKRLNVTLESDETVASAEESDDERRIAALIQSDDWKRVCAANLRGQARRALAMEGFEGLMRLLATIGAAATKVESEDHGQGQIDSADDEVSDRDESNAPGQTPTKATGRTLTLTTYTYDLSGFMSTGVIKRRLKTRISITECNL